MWNGAGALHPFSVRQVAMPRPCDPPKINPPFSKEGTTATHLAELSTSSGMPLSGADMISLSTVAAESARPAALSAKDRVEIKSAKIIAFRGSLIGFLEDDCKLLDSSLGV